MTKKTSGEKIWTLIWINLKYMYVNTDVFVFPDHQLLFTKDTRVVAVYAAVVQDEVDSL